MERSRDCIRIRILVLYLTAATISFTQCDAGKSTRVLKVLTHQRSLFLRTAKKLNLVKRIEYFPFDSSKQQSQEPYDSLAPVSLLASSSNPFCTNPPSTTTPTPPSPPNPQSPYLYIPPILPMQSPPPGPLQSISSPLPPISENVPSPSPPESIPSPTIYFPGPPQSISTPNPPETVPSPPGSSVVPSPPYGFQPSPPVFQPPVVFPPPTTPPSPIRGPATALWCVAKPTVPDPIIQEAMNYACGSGADCAAIQPNGPCFQPDTPLAHASFAFNSYWQRSKVAGDTCEFGGTAMLVTLDPSFDGCQFDYA